MLIGFPKVTAQIRISPNIVDFAFREDLLSQLWIGINSEASQMAVAEVSIAAVVELLAERWRTRCRDLDT